MFLHHFHGLEVLGSLESPMMTYELLEYNFESHCISFLNELIQDALKVQVGVINNGR